MDDQCIFSKIWPLDLDVRRQLAHVDEPTLERWRVLVTELVLAGVSRFTAEQQALAELRTQGQLWLVR